MKFVDQCRVRVKAGDGGAGAIAFRREKYVPFGGPAGGDGARGGDVVFVADEGRTSLLDLAHLPVLRATRGEHGRGKDQYGRAGKDLEVKVPIGTQVFDLSRVEAEGGNGVQIADLETHGARFIVAKGGLGGRGNKHFATPFDRAPHRAEPGTPGEEKLLRLELKVMADVGLLGFPNVGKSTLVSVMSRARPKIADYPFTTLQPHLGVVRVGSTHSSATFVLADIPGLIPGAAEGRGVGARFLKHVERCRALLHLIAPPVDPLAEPGRAPLADFDALMKELRAFAPDLAARPMIVAMSKGDLPEAQEAFEKAKKDFAKRRIPLRLVSGASRLGIEELARDLFRLVKGHAAADLDVFTEPSASREPSTAPRVKKSSTKEPSTAPRVKKSSSKKVSTEPRSPKPVKEKPSNGRRAPKLVKEKPSKGPRSPKPVKEKPSKGPRGSSEAKRAPRRR